MSARARGSVTMTVKTTFALDTGGAITTTMCMSIVRDGDANRATTRWTNPRDAW